ncbi:DUF1127 domain-containing protein [Sedimentitalea todarodis]|uniref:DUF1127 domain-containing protein n=1 Tax=Sedimentitalea todarodis TaxID=1631240 RepID=A0ABU3V9U8_9RHOB|nr:DUF1127 domain-containing protein [Sedimentitalea todarodis]MDU9002549.1 DUF1127 domain-containing protein [Sedimentitalea todarodis]
MSTLALKNSNSAPGAAEWLRGLLTRIQSYRVYRRTLHELSALSDRDLADLGLRRSILKRVAYQAAYEAN